MNSLAELARTPLNATRLAVAVPGICLFALCALLSLSDTALAEQKLLVPKENFNRLFTSRETRALFAQQQHKPLPELIQQGAPQGSPAQNMPQGEAIKVQGYILAEDGKQKIWLRGADNRPLQNSQASVGNCDCNKIAVHAAGRTRLVKPGQTWFVDNERVAENYLLAPEAALGKTQAAGQNAQTPTVAPSSETAPKTLSPGAAAATISKTLQPSQGQLESAVQQLRAEN